MTHCAGYRACAVARDRDLLTIGLDAEPHDKLPDGVKAEAPPAGLIAKLSPSPAGHQYLRVDTDILVVGLGTRNVAALVVDLSRLQ